MLSVIKGFACAELDTITARYSEYFSISAQGAAKSLGFVTGGFPNTRSTEE